jgi:hypothetical protein
MTTTNPTPLGITKGIGTWFAQAHSVERVTDNLAYTSAHPDDTLVLAGPPRKSSLNPTDPDTGGWQSLMAIGMMQTFQVTAQKPTQPLMAIGSGRSFYVSGKSQTSWRIGRLFANGRNLLRALYHNAVAGGVNVAKFDDPAAEEQYDNMFLNLDSELFYVPFGLGAFFKDKVHDCIGGFYAELAMLNSYSLGFTAGQNMIMEDVGGMCDRLLPFRPTSVAKANVPRSTIDAVIGFTSSEAAVYTRNTGIRDVEADSPIG